MIDEYAESAEFIDLLISPHWTALGHVLAEAISGVDPATGPVIDIGAGSGCATLIAAEALPDAEIHAVEPSAGLRSALLAKVNAQDGLRSRVTVLPTGFLEARLPDHFSLVVAMNVIGHFSPVERARIWTTLARQLAPGGRAVLNLQPPSEPAAIPETPAETVRVGRRTYEGSARAEPAGDGLLVWHMTYRTYQDDELVDERKVDYTWHPISEPQLRAELGRAGLEPTPVGPEELGMHTVTRTHG